MEEIPGFATYEWPPLEINVTRDKESPTKVSELARTQATSRRKEGACDSDIMAVEEKSDDWLESTRPTTSDAS